MENTFWENNKLSVTEVLKRAFNPNYPDTSPIPEPDTSECKVSVYKEGQGETPIY